MAFGAKDVKKLREMTGAGMMACKDALKETSGNMEEAVDFLRKKGLAAAKKKQGRVAAEGAVATLVEDNLGILVEVNCETDFVSKGDDFQNFAKSIASFISKERPAGLEELKEKKSEEVNELTLKLGEKIDIRRFAVVESRGLVGHYNHGGRIGALVNFETTASGSEVEELAKDLAMHVTAADPRFVSSDQIDQDYKNREAEIYKAQLLEEGKPENMIDKIVAGKLNKLAKEVCMLEQTFIKNSDLTVKKLIEEASKKVGTDIKLDSFVKYNLGEGIEKKEDNLADEVAKLSGKS